MIFHHILSHSTQKKRITYTDDIQEGNSFKPYLYFVDTLFLKVTLRLLK